MKNFAILFVAVLLFASCSQSKIGYVDVEELMKEYDATKAMEVQLKIEQELMTKTFDSISAPFQAKFQAYYQKANKMSAKSRQTKEQELQQEQQALQARQQQIQQSLQLKGKEGIESLTKTVDSIVESYAIANKYSLILGTQSTGTVMYGEDQINLTETILDILNADFEEK